MQRALLDTNVVIWREAAQSPRADIGWLFYWLDRLQVEKFIHPATLAEIRGYHDQRVASAVLTRAQSYVALKTSAPIAKTLQPLFAAAQDSNTKTDITLLNELACGRVDLLITEDKGIHRTAARLGVSGVISIADFVSYAKASEPSFPEYVVQTIQKVLIGQLNFDDPFFDSLK